jgi:integrase
VREISVHTTRRTCASLLVALDVHPRVAMQILRHSQIAITMNVYSEAPSKATRTALKRLGKQLHSRTPLLYFSAVQDRNRPLQRELNGL